MPECDRVICKEQDGPNLPAFLLEIVGVFPYLVGYACCDNCRKLDQVKKKKIYKKMGKKR